MDHAHLLSFGDKKVSLVLGLAWDPPMDGALDARLATGNATDEEFASIPPDQAVTMFDLVKGRVPEVIGMASGPFILAPVLRDYLETHEPGVHQFLPVRIRTGKPVNGTTEHGTHWLLRAPPRVDCLIFEETYFKNDFQGQTWSRKRDDSNPWGGGVFYNFDTPCTLEGRKLVGRHVWRIATGSRYSDYCCSSEFWQFYRANKMLGWKSEKRCVVR